MATQKTNLSTYRFLHNHLLIETKSGDFIVYDANSNRKVFTSLAEANKHVLLGFYRDQDKVNRNYFNPSP